uniref:NHL repeat containing protein n=1 Tax=Solibacter usitatus (strain Ellin6076) TaxID=234267 RepID=Q02B28_SOLUE
MHSRFVLPLLAAAIASGQTITTVAGNGTAGFAGDTGQATQAQINRAVGLVTDANGNLYLAEELNNRVRKVDTGGVITTLAGIGTAGFAGDGGPAAQAQLNGPLGLCIDGSGNIYVSDQGNKRVRKIAPSGTITTVAGSGSAASGGDGGAATAAGFAIPIRCAVDKSGNLLIVDQGAHKIRKVEAASNIISTFAGNGSQGFSGDGGQAAQASFNNPTALAVDAAGTVYVTDQSNQRIRRIDTGGVITTVAGNGNAAFSGDGGSATAASLNYPGGIVLDSSGTLYIVDSVNQRVRKVSGTTISTVAGTGTAGFSGDGGAALQAQLNNPFPITADGSGNLYVGDVSNNRVRKITGASTRPGPTITSAGVTNAASFQTGIAPGGIITIFGSNLGASAGQIVTAPGAPWPPQVGGVSVTMDGVTAPVYRVLNLNGQEQLSVQAPWSISGKNSVVVAVTTGAGTSQVTVPVLGAQPGIFILDGASSGATHSDGSIAGASNPAARGETLVLYLTGLGPVQNTPASGDAASTTTLSPTVIKPAVTIGGFDSAVIFSGLAPGFIGLYQINVTVPAAVATGTVDLTVLSNGVTSNTAKIPIH